MVIQRENQMNFGDFKIALRNHEENEKCCRPAENGDNVMYVKKKFEGKCFRCDKKGHKSSDCWMKAEKWCNKCKSKTHNTKDCRARRDGVKMAAETGEENAKIHSFAFTLKENNSNGGKTSNLLVDTGATSHIINDKSKFVNFDEKFDPSNHVIELADGSKANVVLGKGNAKVKLYDINGNLQDVMLSNALYIPSYQQNIFSVPAAIEKGAAVSLDRQVREYRDPEGIVFGIEQVGKLYYLNSISSSQNNASSLMEWHKILGHCNYNDVRKLESVVKGMKIVDDKEMCQHRSREPDQRAKGPLEFVHCDLAGPVEPAAKDGFKYALSFVDDFTGTNLIYFLKQKSDTVEATEKFLADIAPFGKVKRIRSDNCTEFTSRKFKSLLRQNSIKHETSAPYSPHQNGTVERAWRSLFSMARCMLLEANLPKRLWTYAVMTAVYIRNRCFNSRLGKTPYETLTGKQPNLSNMHVFGSTCYAFVQNAKKLDDRSLKGVFVGYDKDSPAYLVYHPETNKVEKVRCVKFFDNFKTEPEASNDDQDDLIVPNREHVETTVNANEQMDENAGPAEVENNAARYPTRTRNKPRYLDRPIDDNVNRTVDYCFRAVDIPKCYKQAIKSPEANKWQNAINAEVSALNDNNTFELVPRPKDRQIVGGRWGLRRKNRPKWGRNP